MYLFEKKQRKKKVLLCIDKDQMQPYDYKLPSFEGLAGMGGNSGNNVFQFGMQKVMLSPYVDVDVCTTFLSRTDEFLKDADRINEKYDALVTFPANVLGTYAKEHGLRRWAHAVKKIKKPFHFIGVGAQSDYLYHTDFVEDIRQEGCDFIGSILDTGGMISLRGYFTAEVVKKLGFSDSDFTVTGCPSLFMNGRNLVIVPQDIVQSELKPVLNGTHFWFDERFHVYFHQYPNSVFVDQDVLYRLLLRQEEIPQTLGMELPHLRNGLFATLYNQKRLRIYGDYLAWDEDLKNSGFNFSIGGRIHGNIVSLLAGIPAFIDGHDSRVMELAEYFSIPCVHMSGPEDLFDIYSRLDYGQFNRSFAQKYDIFAEFMKRAGLPFWDDERFINERVSRVRCQYPPMEFGRETFIDALTKYAQK